MFNDLDNDNLERWKYFGSISNGTLFFPGYIFRVFLSTTVICYAFSFDLFLSFSVLNNLANAIPGWLFCLKSCEIFYLESKVCTYHVIIVVYGHNCTRHTTHFVRIIKKPSIRVKYILYRIEVHGFYDWHSNTET